MSSIKARRGAVEFESFSQKRRWPPRAPIEEKAFLHESHRKLPLSSRNGAAVCPARNRAEHAEHSVFGPSGPGPLPLHSVAKQSHHPHLHSPASQKRRCPPKAPSVSNSFLHASHTYLPSSLRSGGPVAPCFHLELHGAHSVFAPLGPGPFAWHSSTLHSHHSHDHLP